jgi:membrane protease YdiL (CAAX protease family)
MASDSFSSVFGSVIPALFLAVSIYIYVWLIRQIQVRTTEPPVASRLFGWPEATLAILLTLWFLLNLVASLTHHIDTVRTRDLAMGAFFQVLLFLALAGVLRLRRFDLGTLAGFSRVGFRRAATIGGLLLLAAYPLVLLAGVITEKLSRGNLEKQEIIEVFNTSDTIQQRMLIILLAVSVAPLTEEFFFRFFLYGVMKRYFGRSVGVLANAFLFAVVHAHLPSLAPLFVLGACLTIAYEWSGSILVSMTMHALFNALALTALAFPEVFPQ